ncbi:hypothetical protein NPIL_302161 [Nephila pilipes]|uniref:Uncharacterized protein n=1 Tax=Nephila pilipes TaxID=299642 RepID=A0A8X6R449_NEPPI|nr:hypothetical protein NPIL_302161 [Nephila pilipes]
MDSMATLNPDRGCEILKISAKCLRIGRDECQATRQCSSFLSHVKISFSARVKMRYHYPSTLPLPSDCDPYSKVRKIFNLTRISSAPGVKDVVQRIINDVENLSNDGEGEKEVFDKVSKKKNIFQEKNFWVNPVATLRTTI